MMDAYSAYVGLCLCVLNGTNGNGFGRVGYRGDTGERPGVT